MGYARSLLNILIFNNTIIYINYKIFFNLFLYMSILEDITNFNYDKEKWS